MHAHTRQHAHTRNVQCTNHPSSNYILACKRTFTINVRVPSNTQLQSIDLFPSVRASLARLCTHYQAAKCIAVTIRCSKLQIQRIAVANAPGPAALLQCVCVCVRVCVCVCVCV